MITAVWLGGLLVAMSPGTPVPLPSIKEALIRNICREVYWYDEPYQMGKSLLLEVKIQDDVFYAWIDQLLIGKQSRESFFYEGRINDSKAVVTATRGYNIDLKPRPAPGFFLDRKKFETEVLKDTLRIPAECPLKLDPPSPRKERMLKTIVKTMEEKLSSYVRLAIASYPREMTITIADFNVDYPETYVLVNWVGEQYMHELTLHDPANFDSEKYETLGAYPLVNRRLAETDKNFLAKIREHGITRKIVLSP